MVGVLIWAQLLKWEMIVTPLNQKHVILIQGTRLGHDLWNVNLFFLLHRNRHLQRWKENPKWFHSIQKKHTLPILKTTRSFSWHVFFHKKKRIKKCWFFLAAEPQRSVPHVDGKYECASPPLECGPLLLASLGVELDVFQHPSRSALQNQISETIQGSHLESTHKIKF